MDRDRLNALLASFSRGELPREELVEMLVRLPFEVLPDARVDTQRALRTGFPEVVFATGKSPEQIARIVRVLREAGDDVLVTRATAEQASALSGVFPDLHYLAEARLLVLREAPRVVRGRGVISVVCAGTSDLPVAEEAALVAEHFGNKVDRIYDAGVAGLHRLLASLDALRGASVVIAIAGMEGALASVVGGLVAVPVIAVPTSIGYGASFGGVAALLAMLNSCAANVTVVNIDNGFGAAYVASLINRA